MSNLRGAQMTDDKSYPPELRQYDYLNYARQFRTAFDDIPERPPPQSWPRYFLLCHAIELALKAYLLACDPTRMDIESHPSNHDLGWLMNEAVSNKLSLSETTCASIEQLTEAHQKFWHRYPKDPVAFSRLSNSNPLPANCLMRYMPNWPDRNDADEPTQTRQSPFSSVASQRDLLCQMWNRSAGSRSQSVGRLSGLTFRSSNCEPCQSLPPGRSIVSRVPASISARADYWHWHCLTPDESKLWHWGV
jgi:hypothetical protein